MIRIENLRMTYRSAAATHLAVDDVTLTLRQGQFYTLLGPSGCGKTSTLRCVAGLETPDSGEIYIGDELVFSSTQGVSVPSHARNIGMVFQSYAIWPHMSVFENVAFPLRHLRPRPSRHEIRERVAESLALVKLENLGNRPAPLLSGGQQQRLALARALVGNPRLLLLDEPLSNLDAKLREEMRIEIRRLVDKLRLTTMFVTHEQVEALTMSDIVAVMRNGKIVQCASPSDIYHHPSEAYIADFIGKTNLIPGRVVERAGALRVETDVGDLACRLPADLGVCDAVLVNVRPENIDLKHCRPEGDNTVSGHIVELGFLGNLIECTVDTGGRHLRVQLHPTQAVSHGDAVRLYLPPDRCAVMRPGDF